MNEVTKVKDPSSHVSSHGRGESSRPLPSEYAPWERERDISLDVGPYFYIHCQILSV